MPAVPQGIALAAKRGGKKPKSPDIKRIAETLSASKLKQLTSTKGSK